MPVPEFLARYDPRAFVEKFGTLDDDAWLAKLEASVDARTIDGQGFPGFPPDELQLEWVGMAGREGVRLSFEFYRDVKGLLARLGAPLEEASHVLDFGCGWGRHLRYFLRDVPFSRLYGVDPDAAAITFCKEEARYGNFGVSDYHPPLDFRDELFDVVYAYSVFSHLAPAVAAEWSRELWRILKPDGVLIMTVRDRYFLDRLGVVAKSPAKTVDEQELLSAFPDLDAARAELERVGHVYRASTPYEHLRDVYGTMVVSPTFVESTWQRGFRRTVRVAADVERQQATWAFVK
jgi:SAM-dependent methyltransferase